ncbi:MAG: DDE-type integrase/transposase/recombinase [Deltaproteobacteria bacterium]|nr:DDE-type integrase/transposase/recombinase [Deltaproteobacteria bacterium]
MDKEQEKWAIFWCDLLSSIIYRQIEPEQTNQMLKQIASEPVVFPDGKVKKPSLSTLKRKLKKYRQGGFHALFRKKRSDMGKPRAVSGKVALRAVELKKDQPKRSDRTINRLLQDQFGVTMPKSTLYRHLRQAGATRIKLGATKLKVRGRWTKENTNDMWEGDFADGPYVLEKGEVVPTYLSAFVDCHSRWAVEVRYYLRENLDVLIDSLIRALTKHGAPLSLYVDQGKVYLSHGLRAACHIMNTLLLHRPRGDPAPGGLIERFILTVQEQFEAEVRAGDILSLAQLNKALSAWVSVSYHEDIHCEINCSPRKKYEQGFTVMRQVDMEKILDAFKQRVERTVHKTFSDVRINNLFFKVDPKLRTERVQVAYDPFTTFDSVDIYSLKNQYLGKGKLHTRKANRLPEQQKDPAKAKYNYIDLLIREHEKQLKEKTVGIDYRKTNIARPWPFQEFAKTFAQLLGYKGGLTSLSADQLEKLKKVYNQSTKINKEMVKKAFENVGGKSLPHIIFELKSLIKLKEGN